jgi:hypothetical protein
MGRDGIETGASRWSPADVPAGTRGRSPDDVVEAEVRASFAKAGVRGRELRRAKVPGDDRPETVEARKLRWAARTGGVFASFGPGGCRVLRSPAPLVRPEDLAISAEMAANAGSLESGAGRGLHILGNDPAGEVLAPRAC